MIWILLLCWFCPGWLLIALDYWLYQSIDARVGLLALAVSMLCAGLCLPLI